MIRVLTDYDNIIADGGHHEWRVQNGENTYDKDVIMSGRLSNTLFRGVSIGNANSAQLDLKLRNVADIDKDAPLRVQFRAVSWDGSDSSGWYTKGWYYIDTLKASPYSEITQITAFDALMKANQPYQSSGEWLGVETDVAVAKIVNDIGVTMDTSTANIFSSNPYSITLIEVGDKGTTDRELLEQIAAAYGGNFFIDEGNHLQFYQLSATGGTIGTASVGNAVRTFDASEAITIRRARLRGNDESYYLIPGVGLSTHSNLEIITHNNKVLSAHANAFEEDWDSLGGYCIDMFIPWGNYEMATDVFYNQLDGKSFVPYNATGAYIDPKYGLWDSVEIKDVVSKIVNQKIEISPLATSSISLEYDEKLNSEHPYVSNTVRRLQYQVAQNSEAITTMPKTFAKTTSLITGGEGGYVKWNYLPDGTPSEILFMDNPNEAQATNIMRLNRNGIGFSRNGGETYDNAWTIDGKLNADFIGSGTIDAINITGSTITGSKLESTASGGSIRISDGSIDFYEDATTAGTPFSQLAHIYNSSLNQHAIEWRTTGYTKLINEAGGQWTGDFIQFALNPSSPTQALQLYPDSDGYHTRILTDYTEVQGDVTVTGKVNGITVATTLINSGSSKTFTVPSGSRHRVTVAGTVTARMAEFIVGCATNGTVGVSAINQGASITMSTTTNSMTIGASGGSASVMITTFSGSPMTFS